MRTFFYYGIATFLARMYAFVAIFLFSRTMSVHEFGLYVLAAGVGEFCDVICSSWFRIGFTRFYHGGDVVADGSRPRNLTPIYRQALVCSAAGVVMAWICTLILVPYQVLAFGTAASLYVLGNNLSSMSLITLRGEERPFKYLAVESFRQLSGILGGLVAARFVHPSFAVVGLAAYGCSAFFGSTVFFIVWVGRRGEPDARNRVPEIIAYASPIIVAAALTATINMADRYQLQWMLGPNAVALYAVAYSIGRQTIDLLFASINVKTFTELMRTYDESGKVAAASVLQHQLAVLVGLGLPAVVGLSLLATQIIHVFFDQRYWQYSPGLVPIISAAALFIGLRAFGFDQGFHMLRKAIYTALIGVPALIISFSLGLYLIVAFGIAGAAYGMLLGSIFSVVLSAALVRRLMPIGVPWLELAKVVLSCGIMAVILKILPWWGRISLSCLIANVVIGIAVYGFNVIALNCLDARRHALSIVRATEKQLYQWCGSN